MANTQPTDTLSGILGAMEFPTAPDLNAFSTGGTTPQPAPTSAGELDSLLGRWQDQALNASDQEWSSYFEQEGTEEMDRLKGTIMPEGEMPKPPSMTDEFQRMRTDYGLDQLEQSLADLKREEREQQAIRRERISGTFEERTRMSAIQGQVSEIERQEMERIDFINREIAYRVDILNSAYKLIDMSMNYMQMDWQNAKEWWTTQFNANLSMYQQLRGEFEADRTFEQQQKEWEQSVATANLQIYADMISNGQIFWEDMDEATRTEIAKLEVKSGLGAGFLSKLQMDPDKSIKSITTRDVGGVRYADIVKVDPRTKKVTVETTKVGAVSMGGGGGGGNGSGDDDTPSLEEDVAGMRNALRLKTGEDGFVSPETWNSLRQEWLDAGLDGRVFDSKFIGFINLTHQNKWGGYKTEGNLSGAKGAYSRPK